ncbi:hypothetical protein JDV02_009349 [Purpureocillium takamizusanense]|uniref:Uncharacterized protein n=1 Tax=Purpureocillium takamizusanense TaxID=2060973 RepID=A0A9Q8QPJ5_9HYPO|nr:uncharacterized protein JDV02_009349 [Purpureocillium takamizusanense]UNI23530.1 hypothetical protein JDV02_009349 [Purpureocillium takamizusanense]
MDFGSGWGAMPPPEPLEDPDAAAAIAAGTTTTTTIAAVVEQQQDQDASRARPSPGAGFEGSFSGGQPGECVASSRDQSATIADSLVPSGLPEACSPSLPPNTGADDYDLWGSPTPTTLDENVAGAHDVAPA